jgi:hypothetical protein
LGRSARRPPCCGRSAGPQTSLGTGLRALTIDWIDWFNDYLDTLADCAQEDGEILTLLEYYGVPLLITGDEGFAALTCIDEVVTLMRGQVDGLRAAEYHHTDVLRGDVAALNSSSALYRGTFSQRRTDGSEIGQVTVKYLLTNRAVGVRISMIAVHDAAVAAPPQHVQPRTSEGVDEEQEQRMIFDESVAETRF